ncbi:DNA internalization-related competence protein ComEC/Rec2 [Actinomyces bovis]|uniref:DNA internalization-related competence protein ComEC/Rec2 n=1 Tax=Actinomyces bovis TaxID=1658 RepID=A0ABY1VLI7_9ACTO|nr:ComEC/Rec2 family competence protein [Actinomyces bovis]SPT52532.1 DNA internalization-related competence protein ComEC/Rec2 [Actinomyces bovis]VEG54278.1 DNA internalization-related competence protein ComEC/Rec2 [Actinomyces israelii]
MTASDHLPTAAPTNAATSTADTANPAPPKPQKQQALASSSDAPAALDLRLAPPALAAWGTAWVAVTATGPGAWIKLALACLAASLTALILLQLTARFRPPRHRHDPRPGTEKLPTASMGSVSASLLLTAVAVVATLLVTSAQLAARQADPLTQAAAAGQPVTVVATLTQAPRPVIGGHGSVFTELQLQSVDGRPSCLTARVIARGSWARLRMGEQIRLRTTLKPTQPGERAAVFITGAQARALAPPSGLTGAVEGLRAQIRRVLEDLRPPGPAPPEGSRELVLGLALGDDSALPVTLREDLRTVSLTHLTAVSGQHVAIVLGLVLPALGVLPRRIRALVGLLVLAVLVVLVRPGGSVLRAATMGTVLLLGVALGRRSVALPALFTGVLVLLLLDPWQARDYGFALSVVATAAILLGARPLEAWLSRLLPPWLALALAIPLVAQLACAPLLVLLRPTWSPWAVLANVLAAPPVAVATVSGLVASLLAPVLPSLAGLLALPALAGCAWIVAVARWTAALPGASLPWPAGLPGALLLLGFEAAGVLAARRWWAWRRARRRRRQARLWEG